jgi:hypothetical protein
MSLAARRMTPVTHCDIRPDSTYGAYVVALKNS